jgi:hypothetical protein
MVYHCSGFPFSIPIKATLLMKSVMVEGSLIFLKLQTRKLRRQPRVERRLCGRQPKSLNDNWQLMTGAYSSKEGIYLSSRGYSSSDRSLILRGVPLNISYSFFQPLTSP